MLHSSTAELLILKRKGLWMIWLQCLIPFEQLRLRQLFCPAKQTLIFAFPNSCLYLWKREWTFRKKKKWSFIFWTVWEILVNTVHDNWGSTQKVCHFGHYKELQLTSRNADKLCLFHGIFPLVLANLGEVSSKKYIISIPNRMWNYPIMSRVIFNGRSKISGSKVE